MASAPSAPPSGSRRSPRAGMSLTVRSERMPLDTPIAEALPLLLRVTAALPAALTAALHQTSTASPIRRAG